jgi:hypothetical protein
MEAKQQVIQTGYKICHGVFGTVTVITTVLKTIPNHAIVSMTHLNG